MPTKQRRLKNGYAAINKNLLNYPLARSTRVHADWRRSKKTGRWLCDLPGDDRIQVRLPSDFDRPRVPTGFDMMLLFTLLKEIRVSKTDKVEFTSLTSLLKLIGVGDDSYNRNRLRDALDLWASISIRHRFCPALHDHPSLPEVSK